MILIIAETFLTLVWILSKETNGTAWKLARKCHKKRWLRLVQFADDLECNELYEYRYGLQPVGKEYWDFVIHYRRQQYLCGFCALALLIIGCCLDTPY